MKQKIKFFLNDDKIFFRVVVILLLFAMLNMFLILFESINETNSNVRALIQGHYEQACFVTDDGYLQCGKIWHEPASSVKRTSWKRQA